jgi:heme-degrading monooxygenase HmoA
MYASIRRYQTTPGGASELARRVKKGFLPLISKAPGFVAYYVIDAGNDWVASVSVFENLAEAKASNRMAADWVKDNIASLVSGTPEITAGEVTVHKATQVAQFIE